MRTWAGGCVLSTYVSAGVCILLFAQITTVGGAFLRSSNQPGEGDIRLLKNGDWLRQRSILLARPTFRPVPVPFFQRVPGNSDSGSGEEIRRRIPAGFHGVAPTGSHDVVASVVLTVIYGKWIVSPRNRPTLPYEDAKLFDIGRVK